MSISNMITANEYYAGEVYWKSKNKSTDDMTDEEIDWGTEAYKKLRVFIKNDDLEGLVNSEEFKKVGINYQFGEVQSTLLHLAYRLNKPKIVEFLLKNGADERISNDNGLVPIEGAPDNYIDSLAERVVNIVTERYFAQLKDGVAPQPDVLFNVIQTFVKQKGWRYYDADSHHKAPPFRDRRELAALGLPHLIYHVNCVDLASLFIRAAYKIGFEAKEVRYVNYKSIKQEEKEQAGIEGEFHCFDCRPNRQIKKDGRFEFDGHYVAYALGWHYDLTLLCRYQDKNAILAKTS